MKDYGAITRMLKADPQLHFSLGLIDLHYGIENSRHATIWGPNPNEGQPDGDNIVLQGKFRPKMGYEYKRGEFAFKARDTLEALDLLDRACDGEEGVRDTAREKRSYGRDCRQ